MEGKCRAPRAKRANLMRKHSLWNNWVCCCEAGEDFGGYWRRRGIGDCRLDLTTYQWGKTCKFHSGGYQEQCYKQAEKVFILVGLGLGRHLFPFFFRYSTLRKL